MTTVEWDAYAVKLFKCDTYPGVDVLRRTAYGREWLLEHGLSTAEALSGYIARMAAKEQDRGPRTRPAGRDTRGHRDRSGAKRGGPSPKYVTKQFIAWDGEGVTVEGDHRYVIFANSEGDSIVNRNGLPTWECFDLLLRCAVKNPHAIHVIFAGSYDANMILKPTLKRGQAQRLGRNGFITLKIPDPTGTVHRFKVTYHARHELRIVEQVWDSNLDKPVPVRAVTLWDVFGSYQSKFTTACESRLPPEDLEELDRIAEMKDRRSSFTLDDVPEMLDYCFAELRALRKLALIDAEDSEAAGIVGQSRWDGAGAKASLLLRANRVRDHKSPTLPALQTMVQMAYAGGRIESYKFGQYDGPVYSVDLRSAYPWAATFLPSLAGGKWEQTNDPFEDDFAMVHLRYQSETLDDLHPFPWRGGGSGGTGIAYPAITEGWYWVPEVRAAYECGLEDRLTLIDAFKFTPATDARPFAFIPELFHARKVLEGQRKGRGMPLKLALNSLYGKLAQQIGSTDGKPPAFHQLEWAGWITSKVRAEMFELAYPRRDALVSIETDGISFKGEPDAEIRKREGIELGDYEVEQFDGGVWVQSGIYWLRRSAEQIASAQTMDEMLTEWKSPKVRGIGSNPDGSDVLDRETFCKAWRAGQFEATVPVEVTRFRGMVTSAISDRRWGDWCQWITEGREIAVAPRGKRLHLGCSEGCSEGLHATLPTGGGCVSSPHVLAWQTRRGALGESTLWTADMMEDDDMDGEERW